MKTILSSYLYNPYLGKTLTLKEKAIRLAKKRNESLEEDMIETNKEDKGNEECEEENPFYLGFGAIDSDANESSDIDSNIKEQKVAAKEISQMHIEDDDTKQETTDTTGRSIIYDIYAMYFWKNHLS